MFDRFNDTARRVIALAGANARERGHDGIGTRHLLLALTSAVTADGQPNAAAAIMAALKVSPEALRDQLIQGFATNDRWSAGHLPFTPNVQRALQACASSADTIGDNHIGPEHLLAGLTENPDSGAGKLLLSAGITADAMPSTIKGSIPAPAPTAARSFNVYLVADAGPFEGGPKLFPSLAAAQLAHPGKHVTGLRASLRDGEFFEVCSTAPGYESWGNFASYSDAFTIAEALSEAGRPSVSVRIMVPRKKDIRGKDNRGHDIVLGCTVDYTTSSVASRISGTYPTPEQDSIHV